MLNKIIISTILGLVLVVGSVAAQDEEIELSDPGITPDSTFYFLDDLGERLGLLVAFSHQAKVERALTILEEKLAESKAMVDVDNDKAVDKATKRYEHYLEVINKRIDRVKLEQREELGLHVAEVTSKHLIVLDEVIARAPEQALRGLEQARAASQHGHQTAIAAVARINAPRAASAVIKNADKHLERARKKINAKEDAEEIEEELERYIESIEQAKTIEELAKETGQDVTVVKNVIKKAKLRHQKVLLNAMDRVPPGQAKKAMQRALEFTELEN